VLKVRVARHAPATGLFLWGPVRPPGLLEKSLLEGLTSIDQSTLVSRFAAGRADPITANQIGRSCPHRIGCQHYEAA
jgi:hypothetical protein